MKALLMLEDGFSLAGESITGRGEVFGEVVFNTSMTGYQEIITDPSYRGQILAFTYPLIGNYGVNNEDVESASPQAEAVLIKEHCRRPFNRRAVGSLAGYLERYGVLCVEGIDTRSLALHLRGAGTMKGAVSTGVSSREEREELLARVRALPGIGKQDPVSLVTCEADYSWPDTGDGSINQNALSGGESAPHVVVYDLGVKYSILRRLAACGCRVTVVPAGTGASRILAMNPDGMLLSNGPGDPSVLAGPVAEVRKLLGRLPVFGICLGHQVLGLALGLQTYKLPFGHRGSNHPVKELSGGRVRITSQNHGYCVSLDGEKDGTSPTHVSLNDGTLEGMENEELRLFSLQFHPEASAGPNDSVSLFDKFLGLMKRGL